MLHYAVVSGSITFAVTDRPVSTVAILFALGLAGYRVG